jgi:SHS2 domain-containing protein
MQLLGPFGMVRRSRRVGLVLTLPQPFEDLGHTADLGVRVRGRTAEEALARLALALGSLLAGSEPVEAVDEERMEVAGGPGLAGTAVAFLRELLYRFATRRAIPAAVEVLRAGEDGAEARVRWGRYDPVRHGEGEDVKAVTWHRARLERDGDEWVGEIVFDV